MREGIEYEFDVCGDMDQDNTLVITKSRCSKLAGGVFPKPGKELADLLKEWLGGVPVEPVRPDASNDVPAASEVPKKGAGYANGLGGVETVAVITEELAAIWKRMCTPRGVLEEFEDLKTAMEKLAGSAGVAEYHRILRQHGVERPRQFKTMQPARLCAKDVYVLLEQLRASAQENQAAFSLGPEMPLAVTELKA
jgi:hypothetical protein